MSTFGEKLKAIREERSLTQDELAKILKTSKQVISRYEKDQRTPKITIAKTYAHALNVSMRYMVDDTIDVISPCPSMDARDELANKIANSAHDFNNSEEKKIIDGLSFNLVQLNKKGLHKVESYTNDLLNINEYRKTPLLDLQKEEPKVVPIQKEDPEVPRGFRAIPMPQVDTMAASKKDRSKPLTKEAQDELDAMFDELFEDDRKE